MDWSGAKKELKRAIELNPKYARAHYFYGMYLNYTGHPDQAVAEFTQAVQLDPVPVDYGADLGGTLCSMGQYDRGIAQLKESLQLEPNDVYANIGLAFCYSQKKMYQDAIDRLQYAMTLNQVMPAFSVSQRDRLMGWLAWTHALSGERDRALTIVSELKERALGYDRAWLYDLEGMIALVYDRLGDKRTGVRVA